MRDISKCSAFKWWLLLFITQSVHVQVIKVNSASASASGFHCARGTVKNVRVHGRGITISDIFRYCMENTMKQLVHASAVFQSRYEALEKIGECLRGWNQLLEEQPTVTHLSFSPNLRYVHHISSNVRWTNFFMRIIWFYHINCAHSWAIELNTRRETLSPRASCIILFVSTELKMEIGHRKEFLN